MDTRISQIERELSAHTVILERYDSNLEKLIEVSANISKLLAVNDMRVETAEKSLDKLELIIEKQRTDFDTKLEKITDASTAVEATLKSQMNTHYKEICKKIDMFQKDFDDYAEKQDTKIAGIERWIWLAVGGATVLGFLANMVIGIV